MSYFEQLKNGILVLLVVLSVTLTFMIWTYTPSYETIESDPVVDISIAKRAKLDEVVLPYKVVYRLENRFSGTTSPFDVEKLMRVMQTWEIENIQLAPAYNMKQWNDEVRKSNRFTMFYYTEIPFANMDDIVPMDNKTLPNASFDRVMVDWNENGAGEMTVHFVSSNSGQHFVGRARRIDSVQFEEKVVAPAVDFDTYAEIVRENKASLIVPSEQVEAINYTYILEEIEPEKFRDALFNDPKVVRKSSVGLLTEEYSDDSALMNVDLLNHSFNFVYPSAELNETGNESELISNSVDFINVHGGWTDDYRLVNVQPSNQLVEYQLFLQGYPVFSDMMRTKISTYWGNGQVYRYVRPFYKLDVSVPSATDVTPLQSGFQIAQNLQATNVELFNTIDELKIGYYLTRDKDNRIFSLQPSWFYVENGNWTRVETLSEKVGAMNGLE